MEGEGSECVTVLGYIGEFFRVIRGTLGQLLPISGVSQGEKTAGFRRAVLTMPTRMMTFSSSSWRVTVSLSSRHLDVVITMIVTGDIGIGTSIGVVDVDANDAHDATDDSVAKAISTEGHVAFASVSFLGPLLAASKAVILAMFGIGAGASSVVAKVVDDVRVGSTFLGVGQI